MSVLDGSEVKRLGCSNVMQADINETVLQANIQGDVMQLMLCWPDVEPELVTVNGQAVTVDGEPVYVLVRDY